VQRTAEQGVKSLGLVAITLSVDERAVTFEKPPDLAL
jgi:hypothetical protein